MKWTTVVGYLDRHNNHLAFRGRFHVVLETLSIFSFVFLGIQRRSFRGITSHFVTGARSSRWNSGGTWLSERIEGVQALETTFSDFVDLIIPKGSV